MLYTLFLGAILSLAAAQTTPTAATTGLTATPITGSSTPFPTITGSPNGTSGINGTSSGGDNSTDVYLSAQVSVGKIELVVENLSADINLNANVAQLVQINAGVAVGIQKVNITIADVEADLELTVRLGHLVDIVNRVFQSLDLNPLLISTLNDLTTVVTSVVGAVDGLLGSITSGGNLLNFIVDNLGNIVQEVTTTAGDVTSSIVGNYLNNMTFTGQQTTLSGGDIQKTFQYTPLNALVNIVFNSLGQVVQATVVKNGTSTATGTATTGIPTSTAAARRR